MTFIRTFFSEPIVYDPHFWSICVEWHFYLLLPLILIGINRFGFPKVMIGLVLFCLMGRLFLWITPSDDFHLINYSIANRLIEFVAGIITARLYIQGKTNWLTKNHWRLVFGVLIAFTGRLFISEPFQNRIDLIGLFARTFDLVFLTFGYGLIILNVLSNKSIISKFLESKPMTFVGKISYSFYIWHWVVAYFISLQFLRLSWINGFSLLVLTFLSSVFILILISMMSYRFLEAPYFRKKT